MKKIILFLLLLAMVLFGYSEQVYQKEFSIEPGKTLDVNLKSGGSLKISGWKENKVVIRIDLKQGSLEDWNLDISKSADGIQCISKAKNQWKSRRHAPGFTITVPQLFNLKLKTLGGGISIYSVAGDISGRTMGGALKLEKLKGEIHLKTMGGEIELKNSDVDGEVKTMGGRVLLQNVIGNINGYSMGGNVIYKNVRPRNGNSKGKMVYIKTYGGSINVEDASYGADVITMGGKIHIKSAKKFVKAKTFGGNIKIDKIDGKVNAITMGGDIRVIMTGDPNKGNREVKLVTMNGNIHLTVPAGLAMDIDLTLEHSEKHAKNFKIVSDFAIDITKKEKSWDGKKSKFKKYIYGKGIVSGGKHKIKIKAVNGNIYLLKSN